MIFDNIIFYANVYDAHLSYEEEHYDNGEDGDERDNDVGNYIIRGLELESWSYLCCDLF